MQHQRPASEGVPASGINPPPCGAQARHCALQGAAGLGTISAFGVQPPSTGGFFSSAREVHVLLRKAVA